MKFLCVGFNWKTPVRIRERLAFDGDKVRAGLEQLQKRAPGLESAILGTCNRTEVYCAQDAEAEIGIEEICAFLSEFHGVPLTEFFDHLYLHEDAGAILHLFKVASGLDSLVLGEVQVLGQVRHAYQSALDAGSVGKRLNMLFQRALSVAKRVQTETTLSKGRLSVASVAVDYIRGVFEYFADKRVLVIGAGKMAELALARLAELRPKELVICNRTAARAEVLATKFGGTVCPFENLFSALESSDIVLSSTGAEEPLVTFEQFKPIQARRKRMIAIVDITVPRDFDARIGELEDVWLWNIDDLVRIRNQTLRAREAELDKALHIVDEETAEFLRRLHVQESGPLIGRLEQEAQRIVEQELQRLFPQLNGLSEEHKRKIEQFAHRLKGKFLHTPKSVLNQEAGSARHHGLFDALRRLFALSDD